MTPQAQDLPSLAEILPPVAASLQPQLQQGGHYSTEEQQQLPPPQQHGSSVAGAIFNLTNSIVGAGAIGLGGAIAVSGGAISVTLILFFALLTKLSLDLVIRLSLEIEGARGSYEDLAHVGLGGSGRFVILVCKFLYCFGCLVAYIVVVKDNFASACRSLLYGHSTTTHEQDHDDWLYKILQEDIWTTWILSACFIFPLCLLRDMAPLASLSIVSIVSMMAIIGIVIYIYFEEPGVRQEGGTFYENWLEIRPGVLERYD
jgi:solute carrier family 38 (sodium-coupled neutral amino acid transporter), member 2